MKKKFKPSLTLSKKTLRRVLTLTVIATFLSTVVHAEIKHDCLTLPSGMEQAVHNAQDNENGGRSCTITSLTDYYRCNHEVTDAKGKTIWEAHVVCDFLMCNATGVLNCGGTPKTVSHFGCPIGKMGTSALAFWCDNNGIWGLQKGATVDSNGVLVPPDPYVDCTHG